MPISAMLSRAQGCLLGQLAGDSLGSLVEFMRPDDILRRYPNGLRLLADGGTWNTIAGQPTDDSEMALMLARSLLHAQTFDPDDVRQAYIHWLDSEPFDYGGTVAGGLRNAPNPRSEANGALMRISPLGIFGARHDLDTVDDWARQEAALTHANPICQQANALFAMAIAQAIRSGCDAATLYAQVLQWAQDMSVDATLLYTVIAAAEAPPRDYVSLQGWVLIAFHNALYQLMHADSLEAGVVDSVMRGGDTDTNAAIAGALLGAVYGREAIPAQWETCILDCRPEAGDPRVLQPRPQEFWPMDALELAEQLLGDAAKANATQ